MAVAMKSVASGAVRPARRTTVRCQAGLDKSVPAAIATAAAVSLVATPAFAGVVLQQPELKKVFQDSAPAPTSQAAPAAKKSNLVAELPKPKAAPAPKAESSGEGFALDAQMVSLPLSVAGIAGGFLVLSKLDAGFVETLKEGALKDSNIDGAGYEVSLKTAGGPSVKVGGTRKVKTAAGTKKGGFTLFGK